MQLTRVFAWIMSALLAASAGPAWAQGKPAKPADSTAGEKPGDEPASGEFEGSDQVMEGGALGGGSAGPRPWAEGVSAEDQAKAAVLFDEGNELLRDSLFLPAVQKYREALQHWDHPGIYYNLSLALMNLDQPIEVYQSLRKAMAYGLGPLDQDKYDRAKSYFALIEKQLARIEIVCDEPDARVTMDGQLLFTGPGHHEGLVRVGEHTVVATKRGYLTENESLALSPGEQKRLKIRLVSLADVTVTKRHWVEWKPWAVVGGGTAVALAGGAMHWLSRSNFSEFDRKFNALCEQAEGCAEGEVPALIDQLDRADRQQKIAVTSYIIGGTTLATGLVLVYLNRPRIIRKDIEAAEPSGVSLVPMLFPGTTGMSAVLRF
jgi:hypothetical protein